MRSVANPGPLAMRSSPLVRLLLLLSLAGLLTLPGGCDSGSAPTGPGGNGRPKRPPHQVEVAEAQLSRFRPVVTRSGTLEAKVQVELHAREEGEVREVHVDVGDAVKREQLLVRLDDSLLSAQLAKARATRRQAEEDLKRQRELMRQKVVSADSLARAETALKVAEAEEQLLTTRIRHTRIHAPFDGVVSDRRINPGDVVSRYAHLLTLIDPRSLVIRVEVSELLLPQLRPGMRARVRIDALGGATFEGRIVRIHPTIDPRTRLGTLEVVLDAPPPEARAGQLGRVTLEGEPHQWLTIPFSALQPERGGSWVWRVDEGRKAVRQQVVTGLRHGNRVAILEGLQPGDRVIVRGLLGLREGMEVRIVGGGEP